MFFRPLNLEEAGGAPDALAIGMQLEQTRQYLGESTDVRGGQACVLGAPDVSAWHLELSNQTRLDTRCWHDLVPPTLRSLKDRDSRDAYLALRASGLVLDSKATKEHDDAHRSAV